MAAVALANTFVRVRPDVDKREFEKDGKAAGETAGKAYADGFYKDAAGRLRKANGQFATNAEKQAILGGEKSGTGFGKSFNTSLKKEFSKGDNGTNVFAQVAKIAASRIALIGAAAGAATPGVLNLTAALLPATGALVALPAAFSAVKIASATVRVAVGETGKAISTGLSGSAKEAEKALKDLTPAQQAFAKTIIALKPQIEGLKGAVSERFFRPFADDIKPLADRYFPVISAQMANLAGPLGGLAEQFAETGRQAQVFQAVPKLFGATRLSVINLRGAIDPLAKAFATTISATAGQLPGLATSITNVARRFNTFVQSAAKSGAITRVFLTGKQTIIDFGGVLGNVGSILISVFKAATTGSGGLLANMRELTGQAAAFLKSAQGISGLSAVFGVLAQLGAAFRVALAGVLPAISEAFVILGPAIGAAAMPMAQLLVAVTPLLPVLAGVASQVITRLTPGIAALAGFLSENATLVKAAAIAFGVWTAAMKLSSALITVQLAGGFLAYLKTIKLVTAATKIWTGIQIAFNAVMALNPFVLAALAIGVLVAAIVIAYKRSETFRAVVQAAWGAIKTAIGAVADWFTGTVVPSLKRAYDTVANAALWLWRNAILPAWNGIRTAVDVVVRAVSGYINFWVTVIRGAAAIVTWFYRNAVAPVFAAIRKVVEIWWFAMRVAFAAFVKILQAAVMPVLRSAGSLFAVIFRAIRAAVSAWWADMKRLFSLFRQYVVGPLMTAIRVLRDAFKAIFSAISTTVRNWWTGTVSPIFANVRRGWQTLATAFRNVYNGSIRPLFSSFASFMKNNVAGAFKTAVGIIRTAWAAVKEAARTPVAFVVNKVINPFIGGLNAAAKVVGVKDRISPIGGFASGGQIPGRPSNRDNTLARVAGTGTPLAVASGEFITNTRSTMANLPLVKAINAKRGKVTRDDVDPYLDGNDGYGRKGTGDGFGDFWKKAMAPFTGVGKAISDPVGAVKKLAGNLLAKIPGGGQLVSTIKSASSKVITGAVKWLTDFGGGALGGGNGPEGWKAKRAIIARWFPNLRMISGPRPGARTLSGNRSLHADGLAVDYPAVRALAVRIRSMFGKSTQELITPWNELNLLHGRPHRYTGAVWNQHNFPGGNAHVHWGAKDGGLVDKSMSGMQKIPVFDKGGILAPGLNLIRNKLGKPEPLLRALPVTNRQTRTEEAATRRLQDLLKRVTKGRGGSTSGGGGGGGSSLPETVRIHPADLETLGLIIGREMAAAVGGQAYVAGRRTSLYTLGA